jgi:hypothetical protein
VNNDIAPSEKKTFFHEALHATEVTDTEQGLFSILPNDKRTLRWFGEAFVEHVTQAAFHGRHQRVYPADRIGVGSYHAERELLATVLGEGELAIDISLLGEAFFEPNTAKALAARRRLDEELRWSFAEYFPELNGQNIVRSIAEDYNRVPKSEREDVLQRWLNRIYSRCGREAFTTNSQEMSSDYPLIKFAS